MRPKIITELFFGPDQGHRKYHTYAHCTRVANFASDYAINTKGMEQYANVLYVAGIWHDAVYIPGRSDNEEMSAQALLALHPQMTYEADLIRKTTINDHLSDAVTHESDPILSILLDADLISLSDPWETFVQHQRDILEENGVSVNFLNRSAEFLTKFLCKEHIYRVPDIRLVYEKTARENISRINLEYNTI